MAVFAAGDQRYRRVHGCALGGVPGDRIRQVTGLVAGVGEGLAGEPPLPAKPGPKIVYQYKPDDYVRRWKPDARAWRPYPGWENMTMAQRREFFGYTYDGPGAPLDMLSPAAQIAIAAAEAAAEPEADPSQPA